jgi:hypothetical protein
MATVKNEFNKLVGRVKDAQSKLQTLLKDQDLVEQARKYAEQQRKEVKKLISGDVARVKTFIERERKELERLQKQIPGELKKISSFLQSQRTELEKLLANVRKMNAKKAPKKKSARKPKASKAST